MNKFIVAFTFILFSLGCGSADLDSGTTPVTSQSTTDSSGTGSAVVMDSGSGQSNSIVNVPPVGLDEFLSKLYSGLFKRTGDAEGLAYWRSHYADPVFGCYGIAKSFLQSGEFAAVRNQLATPGGKTDYMHRLYRGLLGRGADPAGLAYWLAQIPTLGANGIEESFLQSEEFKIRCTNLGLRY